MQHSQCTEHPISQKSNVLSFTGVGTYGSPGCEKDAWIVRSFFGREWIEYE